MIARVVDGSTLAGRDGVSELEKAIQAALDATPSARWSAASDMATRAIVPLFADQRVGRATVVVLIGENLQDRDNRILNSLEPKIEDKGGQS